MEVATTAAGEVAQVSTGGAMEASTTTTSTSTFSSKNKRWSVVAPWIAKLRAVAEIQLALNFAQRPVVFVHFLQSKSDGESWAEHLVQCRETMELLGMIGAVDHAAWIEMLYHDAGCDNALFARDRGDPVTPHFWLSFNHKKEGEVGVDDAACFLQFFGTDANGKFAASDELKRARHEIIRQCTPDMLRKLHVYDRFAIDVKFQPPPKQTGECVRAYLENVLRVAQALSKIANEARGGDDRDAEENRADGVSIRDRFPFKPQFVELDLSEVILPPHGSMLLAEIAAHGVCLGPAVDLNPETAFGRLGVGELGSIMVALTNRSSYCESSETVPRLSTVDKSLRCGYKDASLYEDVEAARRPPPDLVKCEAVLSAFLTSQDLTKLHLREMLTVGSRSEICRKWRWLTYVLFSNRSASSVSSLIIDEVRFSQAEMNAITSVLEAENPVTKLLSGGEQDPGFNREQRDVDGGLAAIVGAVPGDSVSMFLKAGTVVQINPLDSSQSTPSLLELRSDGMFHAIRKDTNSDSVDFVTPGYGHCSVPAASVDRFEITPRRELSSSLSQGYKGMLKSLEFKFPRPTLADVFLPLIKYLGPQLEEITLNQGIVVNRKCLRTILESCPRLRKLTLPQIEPGSEIELLYAFERKGCRISSLAIVGLKYTKDTVTFAQALQDPTTLIATRLHSVMLFPGFKGKAERAVLFAFLDVLKANTSLESLWLGASAPFSRKLKKAILKFNKQELPVSKGAFPRSCQLAFLSAVRRMRVREGDDTTTKSISSTKRRRVGYNIDLDHLDQELVSLIFEFAAERKTRSVSIHIGE